MTLTKRLNIPDTIAAVLFMALAIFIVIQPLISREPRLSPGDPGPWLLPLIFGVGLLGLSVALLLRALKPQEISSVTRDAVEEFLAESDEDNLVAVEVSNMRTRLLGVAALCIAYVMTFQPLGFYLSTGGFLFLSILALGRLSARSIVVAAIIAVLTTAAVGLVLTTFLGVSLPRGPLF